MSHDTLALATLAATEWFTNLKPTTAGGAKRVDYGITIADYTDIEALWQANGGAP